jgi:hypothetical protein
MTRNWKEIANRFNTKFTEPKLEPRGIRSKSHEPKLGDISCRLPSPNTSELTPLEKKVIEALKKPVPMYPRDSSFLMMDFDIDKEHLLQIVKRRLSHRSSAYSNNKENRRVQPLKVLQLNCEVGTDCDNKENNHENNNNASFLLSLLKNRNRK